MYTILRTKEFDRWLTKLRDAKGKARILARIKSVELGNLGDAKSVGSGVNELRVIMVLVTEFISKRKAMF